MRLRLSAIAAAATGRPPGYQAAVIARGEMVDGEWLEISPEALAQLRETYRPSTQEQPLPSLATMASNVSRAVYDEAAARLQGAAPVEAAEIERRIAICKAPCEKWRPSDNRCSECGCFGNFKTRLRSQSCPLGKW